MTDGIILWYLVLLCIPKAIKTRRYHQPLNTARLENLGINLPEGYILVRLAVMALPGFGRRPQCFHGSECDSDNCATRLDDWSKCSDDFMCKSGCRKGSQNPVALVKGLNSGWRGDLGFGGCVQNFHVY